MACIAALALLAAGCGSADPSALLETGDPPPPAVDPAAAPGTTVAEEDSTVNEISKASAKPGDLVKVSAITPKEFAKAHCAKTIMVILRQPGSKLDDELYEHARLAAVGRRNLVSLSYTPADVKTFGDLPSKLGLLSSPGLAIVDRSGRIERFWTTFVDAELIATQLEQAAAAKPCKLGSDDVPAAGSALGDAAIVARGGTVTNTATAPLAGTPPGTPAIDAAAADAAAGALPVS